MVSNYPHTISARHHFRALSRATLATLLLGGILVASGSGRAEEDSVGSALTVQTLQPITAVRGEKIDDEPLQLTAIRDVTGLAVSARNTRRIEDGRTALSGTAITASPAATLAKGDTVMVPVAVDLGGVPSGQYNVVLVLRYTGNFQEVPITIRVRDPWVPPFLVLAGGLALGYCLTLYRDRGKARDEGVSVERLGQHLLLEGTALPEVFRAQIEAALNDARGDVRASAVPGTAEARTSP